MKYMLLVCGALLMGAIPAAAQHWAADFVGTWELVSIEARSETGEWGPWNLQWAESRWASSCTTTGQHGGPNHIKSERHGAPPAEQPEILDGYVAYYAKYEVDPTLAP